MNEHDILSLINRRERQILVHSYIYYKRNLNIIPDSLWSKWAFELASLIERYPVIFQKSDYSWAFEDFDPSSGYYLERVFMRPEIISKGEYLLRICSVGG